MPKIINSVARAAQILQCVAEGCDRNAVISQKLHLNKSTSHRLLKTLELTGLLTGDPIHRKYLLGPLFLRLSTDVTVSHQILVMSAREEIEHLCEMSQETVGLHILHGKNWMILEELLSPHNIKFYGGKGTSGPAYVSAAGKVLLSELSQKALDSLLSTIDLVPLGPNTITDRKVLLEAIEKIREQGYSTSLSERTPGGASIAVPVMNYVCPAALGIVGPESRFLGKRMSFLEELRAAATRISNKLKEMGVSKHE